MTEKTIDDCATRREHIAFILEDIAKNGLPGPRDLDVALDAIDAEYEVSEEGAQLPEWAAKLRAAGYKGGLDLDSLIEACPKRHNGNPFTLEASKIEPGEDSWDGWWAGYADFNTLTACGETPREAVANLLLELRPWEGKPA